MIKKVVAIGPESTGKSTLCEQLAKHFNTIWCPEYARFYLSENGVKYSYNDLIRIAQGQLVAEDYCLEALKNYSIIGDKQLSNTQHSANNNQFTSNSSQLTAQSSQLLFMDTNMYVIKVWYEYVFEKCEQLVLDEIVNRSYDLYLLCNIDLPWTADEMREYPDEKPRIELYNIYKDLLINQPVCWVEISGTYKERLQQAINTVKKIC